MFKTDSILESVGIYWVENIVQAALALLVVLAVIRIFDVNDSGLRVKFFLLPVILPLVGPPTYYALFPNRQQLPVLGIDQVVSLEVALKALDWHALAPILTWAALIAIAISLAGAALSVIGVLYLSRRYAALPSGKSPALQHMLDTFAGRAKIPPPRLLLSPDSGPICGTAGLLHPFLVVSQGLLDRLDHTSLEAAVAHEIAHLRRRDNLLYLFVVSIRYILPFNPAILYLCNRILLESEKDCDRLALSFGISPGVYARSLLEVWQLAIAYPERSRQMPCSFLSSRSRSRERVAALSGRTTVLRPGQVAAWYVTAVLLAVGLFFLC